MSNNAWNPKGLPSPQELGFQKGTFVRQNYRNKDGVTIPYYGVVTQVWKNVMEIAFDKMLMKCHPHDQFDILTGDQWCKEYLADKDRQPCTCKAPKEACAKCDPAG